MLIEFAYCDSVHASHRSCQLNHPVEAGYDMIFPIRWVGWFTIIHYNNELHIYIYIYIYTENAIYCSLVNVLYRTTEIISTMHFRKAHACLISEMKLSMQCINGANPLLKTFHEGRGIRGQSTVRYHHNSKWKHGICLKKLLLNRKRKNEKQNDHDEVIEWKHFPRYWPFVWGIHRSPENSPHKGQWRGALMLSLICARANSWANNGDADGLRRHRAHYDVIVMMLTIVSIAIHQWQCISDCFVFYAF